MNSKEDMLPKKITKFDKLKAKVREWMGYKEGQQFVLDVKPKLIKYSEIELMKIANIEEKLQKAIQQNRENLQLSEGISESEANIILEWIVQNAREGLTKGDEDSDISKKSLLGYCGLGQGITGITLQNMGLHPNVCNANPVLGKNTGRHAFISVEIPIKNITGEVFNKAYVIDTTFKQFFLRNEVTNCFGDYVKDKKYGNRVAPLEGYWMLKMPGGEKVATEILTNGFSILDEHTAKLYGDSFVLTNKERENGSKVPTKKELFTGIEGKEYIQNMFNPELQEELDFDTEELENTWNINVTTPLMKKNQQKMAIEKRRNSTLENEIEIRKEEKQEEK